MTKLVWICMGGAVGSGARYLVSVWCTQKLGGHFPYGTLAVNVLGSLLLGILMYVSLNTQAFSPTVRLGLTVGVMGGFTTYSTFNHETFRYLQQGAVGTAASYVAVTLVCACLAGALGWYAARSIAGAL